MNSIVSATFFSVSTPDSSSLYAQEREGGGEGGGGREKESERVCLECRVSWV